MLDAEKSIEDESRRAARLKREKGATFRYSGMDQMSPRVSPRIVRHPGNSFLKPERDEGTEQHLRTPYGSKLPLQSFSRQGRQFKHHALEMVAAESKRKEGIKIKRASQRQRAWALRLLADLGNNQAEGGVPDGYVRQPAVRTTKTAKSRSTTASMDVKTSSVPPSRQTSRQMLQADVSQGAVAQGIFDPNSDELSHTKYTNETAAGSFKKHRFLKRNSRNPESEVQINNIEKKARARVLTKFLSEHEELTREEAEAKLAAPVQTQRTRSSTLTVVICFQLRSQSVVTAEMIRVLLYTLDCVDKVNKVWFSPPRDECFTQFTFNVHAFSKQYRGTHLHINMVQDLVDKITKLDNSGSFFGSNEDGYDDEYGNEMRDSIKIGLKNAVVVQSSWQQMKSEIDRWQKRIPGKGQRSKSRSMRKRTDMQQAFNLQWPGGGMSAAEQEAVRRELRERIRDELPMPVGGPHRSQKKAAHHKAGVAGGSGSFLTELQVDHNSANKTTLRKDDHTTDVTSKVASNMSWSLVRTMEQQQNAPKATAIENAAWRGAEAGAWSARSKGATGRKRR